MPLYTIRTIDDNYRVTKFDDDLEVESSYTLRPQGNRLICECPQAARGPCRHLEIFDAFATYDRINTGWFYNFETRDWTPPLTDDGDRHQLAEESLSPQEAGEERSGAAMGTATELVATPSVTDHSPPAKFRRF